jgi:hypothetical protein
MFLSVKGVRTGNLWCASEKTALVGHERTLEAEELPLIPAEHMAGTVVAIA